MYIHYRDDAGTRCDAFDNCALARGWNYSCSPNCTPAATATTRGESRTFDWWLNRWSSANYNDPGWQAYNNAANLARAQEGGTTSDVLLPDVASYYPGGTAFDKTVEYYGIPLDGNHPRIQETFDVEASMGAYLSSALGRPVPTIPNAMALSWYYHPYFHTGYQSLNTPIEIEVWLDYTNLNTPMGGVPRALTYEIDYLPSKNVLAESLQGRKFYLQGANDSTSYNTKAQIFLLASYYLLNNKNLAFAYRDATRYNRDGNFFPSDPAQNYVWFQGMAYDVGVPVVNSFGLRDVFGAAGTTEHAEFATGNDPSTPSALSGGVVKQYHLFARQYSKALVLAKFLTYGGSLGPSSATTHQLGGTYRRLLADGTLDAAVITSITLENNEAAILVPVDVTAPAAVTDLQAQ